MAQPPPEARPTLAPGEPRTPSNTPWGYSIEGSNVYGLHKQNLRFFFIVAIWYSASVLFVLLASHAVACTLEQTRLNTGLPSDRLARRRWWLLRLLPMVACIGSIGTDWSRGQVDILMLVVIALALYLAASRRDLASGFCLAFPATVKLFPPFLLLYPLWRRRWRMAAGVLIGLVSFLVLVPAVALGPARTIALYRHWSEVLAKPALGKGMDKSRLTELTGMNSTDNQSLLAAIHNWQFHRLARSDRPAEATQAERLAVYFVTILLLAGVAFAAQWRPPSLPLDLLLLVGLLIGVALVVSPIVHNYYYLLMLPLIAALLQFGLFRSPAVRTDWNVLLPLLLFMTTDLVARLPGIGGRLREWGFPLLSLFYLLVAAGVVLFRERETRPSVN